jgi:hypothetical protein
MENIKMKTLTRAAFILVAFFAVSLSKDALAQERISVGPDGGDNCINPPPAEIGYRPSLFECNGNAAILLRGRFRNIYSVVLRRNGAKNDRDRFNPGCALAKCSPFKVQKTIELPDQEVNCLGDTGFGTEIGLANRISIKFRADITNANDHSQFEQYCLLEKQNSLH